MAYYLRALKRLQEEKKKKEDQVYVVEDEKGKSVNQDRVKIDTVMKPIQQKLETRTSGTRKSTSSNNEKKWYQKGAIGSMLSTDSRGAIELYTGNHEWAKEILQVPEVFKGNLDRFDDGYQFGDITKTAAETVGDTILTVGGTVADAGMGVVKGILNVGEGIGDAISYGTAQVYDWTGKDEKADEIRERASKDIFNEAFKKPQSFVDKASILGDTGDKVSEGIGYMASIWATGQIGGAAGAAVSKGSKATKALSAVDKAAKVAKATKVGTTLGQSSLIFTNSTGTNMADIYDQYGVDGVTDKEAWQKSLGSAAIETTTELMFGMFGNADAKIVNGMANRAKTALGSVIARAGGQAAGEGFEEIVSYAGNWVWDRAVDAANKGEGATFAQEWSWEDMWEQAGIAALTALAMGGGQTSMSTINNKTATNTWGDAISETARQQNASAQVENLNDEIADIKKQIKKTTDAKQLQELQTELEWKQKQLNTLETGSNAIPTNTTAPDNTAQIEGLQNAIEEKTQELQKSQDVREKQIIQEEINILQEELNEATNAQTITDESELKRQNFVYQAQETDSDVRKALYESASKYVNNTTVSHTFVDIAAKIAEDTGTPYEFVNTQALKEAGHNLGDNVTIDGLTQEDKVLINVDSPKYWNIILGHETTHLLEGTQEYQALQDMVIEYAKEKGIYEDRVNNLQKLYQGTNADVNAELTSDLVGELLFTDQSFVESLSVQQPTIFQKIYDYIKHIYKMATAGSKEARQLEELKYKFDKAYKAQGKTSTDTKYSISDNQGRTLTKEQQEFFKDSKVRDENGNLLTVYHGVYDGKGFNVFDLKKFGKTDEGYLGEGFYFTDSKSYAEDYTDSEYLTGDFEYSDSEIKEVYLDIKNPYILNEKNYGGIEEYELETLRNKLGVKSSKEIREKLIEQGYDGIILESFEAKEIVAFYPNQIKNVDNAKPTSNPDIRYSLSEEADIDAKINSSMTMEEAKDMVQRAFMLNNIYEWYDRKYKNGDEWLAGEGIEEVAMYIENSYQLQDKYLNKIYDRDIGFGDDFLLESIVEAYQNGTLVGTEKQEVKRLDTSKEINYQDNRFYAPQNIQAGKELYEAANQRVTNANRQEVYKARADFIIAAHNKGFAEAIGLTQEEVNKKLKNWANYTKKAMDLSNSLNEGVALQNRWAGIENSSIVNTISISNEQMESLVKEVKGDSSGWQRQYITSTMLALDTHIDYSNLTFEFEAGQKMSKNAAGQYFQDEETIRISHAGQNTVAHEIGHYLDHKWSEDLGFAGKSLTDKYLKTDHLNAEQKQFVENFKLFVEDIENSSYLGSEYSNNNDYWQRSNEVFARFVGKFTEWVKNQATNNRYGYEDKWYKDNFTDRQYREFVKLLQEKSMLDAMYKNFKDDLLAKLNIAKEEYSLSNPNGDIAPIEGWKVSGEDLKLQVEEAIAPLQETIENLTEQVQTLQENIIPTTEQYKEVQPTQPTLEEVQNLMDIRDNKSGSEYARAFFALRDKYGQVELYKSLNEYYSTGTVTQPNTDIDTAPVSQEVVEKLGQEAFNTITDEQAPSFEDTVFEALDSGDFEYSSTEHIPSPLDSRDIDEVGNRKVKAYQYENPDVKPYFQEEAQNMLYDLDNTIKGERGAAIDELGNYEYYGITRQTTEAIAYLKDNYGYSYDQIRKGLNAIIEDDGKENNAVSKRIEFMLDERLREGYTTSDGIPIPANEDYINFLNEKQITQYNQEAFNALTDEDVPLYEEIEPPKSTTAVQETQTENNIPIERKTAQNENMDVSEGKQRKWIKTSTESKLINREILPDDLDQSKIIYVPISNKDTLAKANTTLSTMGYKKALEYFNNKVYGDTRIRTEDIALGERLLAEAKRLGDKKTEGELLQNIAILGTEMGQNTQILSIVQRMTPEGQLLMLEKIVNRGKVKRDKAFTNVELTDDMRNKILDTYNEDGTYDQDALNQAVEDVKQDIADQMTVTLMDKINAWRYLSMLGNPKTHNRNLVSNVAMKGTLSAKNAVARTIETIAPIENRTKTWKPASQEVKDFAKQTTIEMKDIITGDSKYNETADIKSKRKIFKSKLLNTLSDGNSNLLSKEDWWFSKGAFENSFSEFLTANGITTQEDIKNNAELIEKGKQYALEQSQIATFRQYSWLANKIGDIERKNAATQIAVGAVLPFKKTPINIAKTGLSYSPLGFAKTLTYDIAQVKKGNMEASTLIDHIAQNTVGSALTLVGYMLAQAGFLNGAGDDDKEGKYDYQLGKQAYSINIGDNTYSLSWLTPVAMPLFVGANAYEQLVEGEEWNADVVIETLGQTLDPLSEMSFLSSLDSVLSSYDSGIQKFFGIGEAALQNYATQFIPTASSQLAATMDDTKRTTKVSGDSTFKFGEELYNQIIYKIPGLRETLEPSTDIWGNEIKQSENLLQRAFENFISPYSRKESIATEIDEELKDLFSQTGDNGILPNIPSNYVNYDGEKYNMSAEEYTDYKKTYGQTANDLLEDLFRTATYGRATAEERTEMVNKVYDYARDEAKLEYLGKEGVEYTNTTEDGEEVYKENLIKGAIENDMSIDEYELYLDDPEEYSFLKEKDYSYRRKYFDTRNSLKEIEETFDEQKEGIDDDDELDVLYSEKKTSIINSIVDSGLEDTEKASLYKKYYNSDTIDTIAKALINVDDYLIYETKEFKADKNEKGNSIPGSRKDKVIDYVNTLDMSIAQKAILIKSTNTFKFNDYNAEIVEYVSSLNLEYEDMVNILEDLDMTVKGDMVYWE